jgi:hypothetical protein
VVAARLVSHSTVIGVAAPTIDKDLKRLEVELKQLEAEYNMYFAGRLKTPPWETRSRVEALVKQYDRGHISNYGDRFRFTTLQARYATLTDLWDRGMRAREEGRPGPFSHRRAPSKKEPEYRIVHVAAFRDPVREIDKLTDLYESLSDARKEMGEDQVPFHRFAELVKTQVKKLRASGSPEVAFRVAVKDGKVNFTARALKGVKE